ncbi:(2Fe-2S) ferredoxin domain-containing protein [Methylogaea oryzae]|uniref:NADH-quinone oxidoreductase subunit E n=1 Tax=Methylogaea oryzae TaxID=1295382 RepID=A0A8D4VSU5_9GAMM|nr:(2Fe-2S) ferredoxin domain-containing protein [Methylogaea oryzae]BBL71710.1 hypothetical protein MoryE10_23160 [Methylogaea oryzae]
MGEVFILVCVNERQGAAQPSCAARGGLAVLKALQAKSGRDVKVATCRCLGRCEEGPVVRIGPGGPFHLGVTASDAPSLVDEARRFAQSLPRP